MPSTAHRKKSNGSLELEVENTGEDSYLSKVITMVREAQEAKSKTQALSDKAAFWLTVIALTVGFATLAGWLISGRDFQFSLARAEVGIILSPAVGTILMSASTVIVAINADACKRIKKGHFRLNRLILFPQHRPVK